MDSGEHGEQHKLHHHPDRSRIDCAPDQRYTPDGIVNLRDEGPAKAAVRTYFSCSGNFGPQAYRLCAQFAMMAGGYVVARDVKQVGDRIVDGDEAL